MHLPATFARHADFIMFPIVFCSSSMSSSLNSLAAVTWEDALKPHLDHRLSELKKTVLLKVLGDEATL